jgi:hypothetical protein
MIILNPNILPPPAVNVNVTELLAGIALPY